MYRMKVLELHTKVRVNRLRKKQTISSSYSATSLGHSRASPLTMRIGTRSMPRFLCTNSFQIHARCGRSKPTNDTNDSGVDVRHDGTDRSMASGGSYNSITSDTFLTCYTSYIGYIKRKSITGTLMFTIFREIFNSVES